MIAPVRDKASRGLLEDGDSSALFARIHSIRTLPILQYWLYAKMITSLPSTNVHAKSLNLTTANRFWDPDLLLPQLEGLLCSLGLLVFFNTTSLPY